MAAAGDPDLDDLFKDIGNKLGWFEHSDLTDAINKLSIQSESKTPRRKKSSNKKENSYSTSKKKSKSVRKLPNGKEKSKSDTPSSQTVQTTSTAAKVSQTTQDSTPSITSTPILSKDLPLLEDNFIKTRDSLTNLSSLSDNSEPQGQSFEQGCSVSHSSYSDDVILPTQMSDSLSGSCQSAQIQVSFSNSQRKSFSPVQDIRSLPKVENVSQHSLTHDDFCDGYRVSPPSQKSIQLQLSFDSCEKETETESCHDDVNSPTEVSVSVIPDSTTSLTDDASQNSVQLQVSLDEVGDDNECNVDCENATGNDSITSKHDSQKTSDPENTSCHSMQIQVSLHSSLASDVDCNDPSNASAASKVSIESMASFESFCSDEAKSPFDRPAKQSCKSIDDKSSDGSTYRLVDWSERRALSLSSDDEPVDGNRQTETVFVSSEDELPVSGRKPKVKGQEMVLESSDDEDFVTVAETLDDLVENKIIVQLNSKANKLSDQKSITKSNKIDPRLMLSSDSEEELPSLDEAESPQPPVKPRKFTKTGKQTPHSAKKTFDDSDSSDDDFESFITEMKTPAKQKKVASNDSLEEFLVSDSDVEQDDSIFYLSTSNQLSRVNESVPLSQRVGGSLTTLKSKGDVKPKQTPKSKSVGFVRPVSIDKPHSESVTRSAKSLSASAFQYGFMKSLSTNVPEDKRHLDARRFVKSFRVYKEELTKKLFKLYNETVFDNQLNSQLEVKWNKRLLKTAGYCAYKRDRSGLYTARIELSEKVCDSAERVRDTLIHEMCHAAVWLINEASDGHGPLWKYWAKRSTLAHHDLPDIKRCHSYAITTKYKYRCTRCSYQFGRHSKSLDTSKKVCGYCRGTFELLIAKKDGTLTTPRKAPATPNRFAMFVKEHYATVKNTNKGLTHKDVMAVLSDKFSLTKIS